MKLIERLKAEDETLDSFYHGRILVLQKKKGYRFSVDAPLLADFIRTSPSDEILELGAGSGIISVLLSIKPFRHITAVEIQESLADMARRNKKLNKLERKISVVQEDMRRFQPGKKFDVIFSNPPYIKKGEGHLSLSLEKSIAKHELACNIFDVTGKTAELLKPEGRAYFVFNAKRMEDFLEALKASGLRLKSIRFVSPRKEEPPNLFLAECRFSAKSLTELPLLLLYDDKGHYTEEAERIFRGRVQPGDKSMEKKIQKFQSLLKIRSQLRTQGKTVVFTNGCFDLLHSGHVYLFRKAKRLGDVLIVAVNDDASVRRIKGQARPIFPLEERLEILEAIEAVGYLTPFSEDTPQKVISKLLPDVLVKGGDWKPDQVVGRKEVERAGGKVVIIPYLQGRSTSEIVERLIQFRGKTESRKGKKQRIKERKRKQTGTE